VTKAFVNRWGARIEVGQPVTMALPRGGYVDGIIAKIETEGEFALAYGARVTLDNGTTGSVDDCRIGIGEGRK